METRDLLRVAVVQMVSTPRVAENVATAERLVAAAAHAGAEVVVLPEYWPIISAERAARFAVREPFGDGPLQKAMAEWASRYQVWLIGGTVPLAAEAPAKVRNSCLVYGPDGALRARYDKIHLFRFARGSERYDEAEEIDPGDTPVAFDLAGWRVGLAICYDLRFPELFRMLASLDAFVLPAAFTYTTGQAHWAVLLRARAIENLCYVAASAQGGGHESGRRTWGRSMLVDPWGEVQAALGEGVGWVMAEWQRARLAEVRQALPALAHRQERLGVLMGRSDLPRG